MDRFDAPGAPSLAVMYYFTIGEAKARLRVHTGTYIAMHVVHGLGMANACCLACCSLPCPVNRITPNVFWSGGYKDLHRFFIFFRASPLNLATCRQSGMFSITSTSLHRSASPTFWRLLESGAVARRRSQLPDIAQQFFFFHPAFHWLAGLTPLRR